MGEGPLMKGASRRYIMDAVEASLRRLGTDYIDLYQVHFPDRDTPLEETMGALDDLVRGGKVRYIGNSNFAGWEIASGHFIAQQRNLAPFVSAQNDYSLLNRGVEREVVPACEEFGLSILPYFPLASGLLTGKYRRTEAAPEGARLSDKRFARRVLSDRNWDIVEGLEKWAGEHGRQPAPACVRLARLQAARRERDRGRRRSPNRSRRTSRPASGGSAPRSRRRSTRSRRRSAGPRW